MTIRSLLPSSRRGGVGTVPGPLAMALGLFLAAPAQVVEYAGAHWFDGTRFAEGTRYVVDGRMQAERPARIDARVDLEGGWVVPAFGEAHNHNLQNAWGLERNREMYLREGVFYAAMLCGDPDSNRAVRAGLREEGDVDLALTACISSPDGHPLGMALSSLRDMRSDATAADVHDSAYVVMDAPDDIDAKWPLLRAAEPDLVKAILVHSEDEALLRMFSVTTPRPLFPARRIGCLEEGCEADLVVAVD